jgi:hypothetical protein
MLIRSPRSHRSPRLPVLAAGALLSVSLLGGCGFDYATDRVNTIGAGVNDREGDVDVLGAVVIAGEDNSGVFVATLVNKDLENDTSLDAIAPSEQVAPLDADSPIEVVAGGRTSLFDEDAIAVGGEFGAGDFVEVTLQFASGQVTTVEVPVVTPCHQYSPEALPDVTLPVGDSGDTPIDPGTGTEAPTEPEELGGLEGAAEAAEGEEAEDGSHSEELPDKYSCEPVPQVEHGGGEE